MDSVKAGLLVLSLTQAHTKGGSLPSQGPSLYRGAASNLSVRCLTLDMSLPLSGLCVPLPEPTKEPGGTEGMCVCAVSQNAPERQDGRVSFLGAWTRLTV